MAGRVAGTGVRGECPGGRAGSMGRAGQSGGARQSHIPTAVRAQVARIPAGRAGGAAGFPARVEQAGHRRIAFITWLLERTVRAVLGNIGAGSVAAIVFSQVDHILLAEAALLSWLFERTARAVQGNRPP